MEMQDCNFNKQDEDAKMEHWAI
jgi:hypothetical protein